MLLLSLHLGCLALFCIRWLNATKVETGKRIFLFNATTNKKQQLSPIYIASTLLTSNYIGICFARTLHYQFYSWYFHSLPFLLWCNSAKVHQRNQATTTTTTTTTITVGPIIYRLVLLVAIEMAFLTFPATPTSAAVLQLAHAAVLVQIQPPNVLLLPEPSSAASSAATQSKTQHVRRKEE